MGSQARQFADRSGRFRRRAPYANRSAGLLAKLLTPAYPGEVWMSLLRKRIIGGLGIVFILAVGIFLLEMPLLAFIFALMVLIFSLSED
jgi:hypothetical protein